MHTLDCHAHLRDWHALPSHMFSNLLFISSWWPKLVFHSWKQAAESWQLEELLLLQSGTKGRVYCPEYLHAWQISRVDWRGSIGCGHAVWCQLFQHRLGGVFFLVDYVNRVGGVIDVLFGRFTTRHPFLLSVSLSYFACPWFHQDTERTIICIVLWKASHFSTKHIMQIEHSIDQVGTYHWALYPKSYIISSVNSQEPINKGKLCRDVE